MLVKDQIIGASPAMRRIADQIERAASRDLTVLIRGETGTGKELVARAIHARSSRSSGSFTSEACGAIPEGLAEAELFGHEAGAFTGARGRRAGMFERASGGTLFIDEVADLGAAMQARLLRVLQEDEVRPLGADAAIPVNVRLIATSRYDLESLARGGTFRRDLLYRLAVVEIYLPALRDRREDIPLLANHFLEAVAAEEGRRAPLLSEAALDRLLAYEWPGNVRELENAIRVASLFASGDMIGPDAFRLGEHAPRALESAPPVSYQALLDDFAAREKAYVEGVLAEENWNKAGAARALGISRYAFYRVLRRLGIEEADASAPTGRRSARSSSESQRLLVRA
jgi:two-component system, NtrC family, response regulator AtoC